MLIEIRLRIVLLFILSAGVNAAAYSDTSIEARMNEISEEISNTKYSKDDIENINKYIDTFLTWKVKENEKAYMMFIDYPYQNPLKPVDYLSLTLIKEKGHKQPVVFSISCGSMIDEKQGMSIYFAKSDSKNRNKTKVSDVKLEGVTFTTINSEYLKVSFPKMKHSGVNLLEELMTNDHLFINIVGKDGNKYKIGYPLFKFKEQYQRLL